MDDLLLVIHSVITVDIRRIFTDRRFGEWRTTSIPFRQLDQSRGCQRSVGLNAFNDSAGIEIRPVLYCRVGARLAEGYMKITRGRTQARTLERVAVIVAAATGLVTVRGATRHAGAPRASPRMAHFRASRWLRQPCRQPLFWQHHPWLSCRRRLFRSAAAFSAAASLAAASLASLAASSLAFSAAAFRLFRLPAFSRPPFGRLPFRRRLFRCASSLAFSAAAFSLASLFGGASCASPFRPASALSLSFRLRLSFQPLAFGCCLFAAAFSAAA